jgi:hypothetical protein
MNKQKHIHNLKAFGDDGTSNVIAKKLKKGEANKIVMMHAM